jgi:bifunctional NMN adenylyltransferase/nudix hydrolase
MKIGVVIGRFQVPHLTDGHTYLLHTAGLMVDKLIILVGRSEAQTKRNPLPYQIREEMIAKYCKSVMPNKDCVILPLNDHPDDAKWAVQVNDIILRANGEGSTFVFGGRDSCLDTYVKNGGLGHIINLQSPYSVTGTWVRENIKHINSNDFRAGMIYKSQSEFPRAYPVVDVVIWRPSSLYGKEYLVARKPTDEAGKWRFIGGFVDPTDSSYEGAVRREAREETGIEVDWIKYCGSVRIDDWRYKKCEEKVISTVYSALFIFGDGHAKDDISETYWMALDQLKCCINPVHKPILDLYEKQLNSSNR